MAKNSTLKIHCNNNNNNNNDDDDDDDDIWPGGSDHRSGFQGNPEKKVVVARIVG